MTDVSPSDIAKFSAARRSADFVADGMKLGLGTGSTAAWMVRCVAARVRNEGLRLTCVPTSNRTADQARALGLTVTSLEEAGRLDLTIDGADEIDPAMDLIKGGGGAHLREKIVATASDRMIVIADPGKHVGKLGAFPLPVEVIPFGLASTRAQIEDVLNGAEVAAETLSLRMDGPEPFCTDQQNHVFDLSLGAIEAPASLATALNAVPGVVETGLFLGICDLVITGHSDGRVETISAPGADPEVAMVDLSELDSLPG